MSRKVTLPPNSAETDRGPVGSNTGSVERGEETSHVGQVPPDRLFQLLKNPRRRSVLRFLKSEEGTVPMRELTRHVAAWECDKPPNAITSDERKRVYVALYQGHLPMMEEMGVISYNQPRGVIERGPNAPQVEPYLETTGESGKTPRIGPSVGPAVAGMTLLPVALVLSFQGFAPVLLTALVALFATVGGVARIRSL